MARSIFCVRQRKPPSVLPLKIVQDFDNAQLRIRGMHPEKLTEIQHVLPPEKYVRAIFQQDAGCAEEVMHSFLLLVLKQVRR